MDEVDFDSMDIDYLGRMADETSVSKPAENVDLDRLDALFAAATKHYAIGVNRLTANRDKALEWAESTYNAYPALAAELRTLRAREADDERDNATRMTMLREALGTRDVHGDIEGIERLAKEVKALRARVAELERKGGE